MPRLRYAVCKGYKVVVNSGFDRVYEVIQNMIVGVQNGPD